LEKQTDRRDAAQGYISHLTEPTTTDQAWTGPPLRPSAKQQPVASIRWSVLVRDRIGAQVNDSILLLSATPLCLPPFWLRPRHMLSWD